MSGPTPETVRTLVENHRQFRAFLEQRVGNPADAEEILQTAFLKTVERGDAIRDEESAVAWFYRLLRNALIDYLSRRWNAPSVNACTTYSPRSERIMQRC
jgi:RNA polymerase sigma-70 factor (ECF subfamily)